jgi:hypothetical protein
VRLSGGLHVLNFENRYRHKDGTYRWLEWAAVPNPSEQVIYAAARDITERKEARETIARYSRDLAAARQAQAEGASRLSRLVSELEVRDLLQVVQSALQASIGNGPLGRTPPCSRGGGQDRSRSSGLSGSAGRRSIWSPRPS